MGNDELHASGERARAELREAERCGTGRVQGERVDTGGANGTVDGVVGDHWYCVTCGARLRGLKSEGLCRDCDTAVATSLEEVQVRDLPIAHLRRVKCGLTLVLIAIVLMVVWWGLGAGLFISEAYKPMGGWIGGLDLLQGVVGGGLTALGYWWFTTPEPREEMTGAMVRARRLVRITAVLIGVCAVERGLMSAVVFQLGATVDDPLGGMPQWMGATHLAVQAASLLLVAVQFFAVIKYVRWLAARIPTGRLVRATRTNQRLLPVLMMLPVLSGGLAVVALNYSATLLGGLSGLLAVAMLTGPLAAVGLYAAMLEQLRERLGAVVRGMVEAR